MVFSFPKRPFGCYESASSSLKIHAKKFFRASRGQIAASRLCQHAERLRAPPSAVRFDSGPYHFFYAAAAPVQIASLAQLPPLVCLYAGAGQLSVQSCCCVRFSCCSPILRLLQLLLPDCIDPLQLHAAPRSRPLPLLLAACSHFSRLRVLRLHAAPRLRLLRLLLPDCVRLCSPIVSPAVPAHARARTFFVEFEVEIDYDRI